MTTYARENPKQLVAGTALAVGGATVLAPAMLVGGLHTIGLGSGGVAAGMNEDQSRYTLEEV